MREFAKLQHSDDVINRIQDNIADTINPLAKVRLLDGVLLESVSIPTGSSVKIAHKLGQAVKGYILTALDSNAVIWQTQGSEPEKFIYLNSSANAVVDIWVFK